MFPLSAADTETDTIIIGNGPSAMILSYILHGHIPYYTSDPPHPDPLLDAKLRNSPCLLRSDLDTLTDHFAASRLSYSTQALPVNVLLDALLRPHGETDDLAETSNLEWRVKPKCAIPHVVIGNAPQPGGLWAVEDQTRVSWDIQTLSYAGMLSLPAYTFAVHYRKTTGRDLAPFTRPTRRELAEYLQVYPAEAGIEDAFRNDIELSGIERTADGFYVRSHGIRCRHLVLATGIFSHVIQPPPLLAPLTSLPRTSSAPRVPLLVIGSGFTAADVIISASTEQPILHVFRWDPETRPSPLRGCHQQAYPEYAGIYRLMKRAALASSGSAKRPKSRRLASIAFLESRNWDGIYEGFPNAEVEDVETHDDGPATVTLRLEDGTTISRSVCGLGYGVGRRGSLGYLEQALRAEVLSGTGESGDATISGKTLRTKVMEDLEVASDVFVVGSLTGDSLIRFAFGGCVYAAATLIPDQDVYSGACTPKRPAGTPTGGREALMNGMDGHIQRAPWNGPSALAQCVAHAKDSDNNSMTDECRGNASRSSEGPQVSNWWKSLINILFR